MSGSRMTIVSPYTFAFSSQCVSAYLRRNHSRAPPLRGHAVLGLGYAGLLYGPVGAIGGMGYRRITVGWLAGMSPSAHSPAPSACTGCTYVPPRKAYKTPSVRRATVAPRARSDGQRRSSLHGARCVRGRSGAQQCGAGRSGEGRGGARLTAASSGSQRWGSACAAACC
jgi:hypothetical protein